MARAAQAVQLSWRSWIGIVQMGMWCTLETELGVSPRLSDVWSTTLPDAAGPLRRSSVARQRGTDMACSAGRAAASLKHLWLLCRFLAPCIRHLRPGCSFSTHCTQRWRPGCSSVPGADAYAPRVKNNNALQFGLIKNALHQNVLVTVTANVQSVLCSNNNLPAGYIRTRCQRPASP